MRSRHATALGHDRRLTLSLINAPDHSTALHGTMQSVAVRRQAPRSAPHMRARRHPGEIGRIALLRPVLRYVQTLVLAPRRTAGTPYSAHAPKESDPTPSNRLVATHRAPCGSPCARTHKPSRWRRRSPASAHLRPAAPNTGWTRDGEPLWRQTDRGHAPPALLLPHLRAAPPPGSHHAQPRGSLAAS